MSLLTAPSECGTDLLTFVTRTFLLFLRFFFSISSLIHTNLVVLILIKNNTKLPKVLEEDDTGDEEDRIISSMKKKKLDRRRSRVCEYFRFWCSDYVRGEIGVRGPCVIHRFL